MKARIWRGQHWALDGMWIATVPYDDRRHFFSSWAAAVAWVVAKVYGE